SDTEIFFDTNLDGYFDLAVFLTNASTGGENIYVPELVIFDGSPAMNVVGVSRLTSVRTDDLEASVADTNAFNNGGVVIPLKAFAHLGLIGAAGTGQTLFQYQVITFDRLTGDEVDESSLMTYDLANPGLEVDNSASAAG